MPTSPASSWKPPAKNFPRPIQEKGGNDRAPRMSNSGSGCWSTGILFLFAYKVEDLNRNEMFHGITSLCVNPDVLIWCRPVINLIWHALRDFDLPDGKCNSQLWMRTNRNQFRSLLFLGYLQFLLLFSHEWMVPNERKVRNHFKIESYI